MAHFTRNTCVIIRFQLESILNTAVESRVREFHVILLRSTTGASNVKFVIVPNFQNHVVCVVPLFCIFVVSVSQSSFSAPANVHGILQINLNAHFGLRPLLIGFKAPQR